jgi:hypothetical protein
VLVILGVAALVTYVVFDNRGYPTKGRGYVVLLGRMLPASDEPSL